ncbi:MAG: CARDB domain-containing protein [candidate division WOR-3 bacterium]
MKKIFLFILIFSFLKTEEIPPFGTVVNQWRINLAPFGGGVTWSKKNNSFYILTYSQNIHQCRIYRFFPDNPSLSYEISYLNYPNFDSTFPDYFYGIAYNQEERCLWHIQYVDLSLPPRSIAVKMREIKPDTFRFYQNPSDTWFLSSIDYGIFGDFDYYRNIYYTPNQNSTNNWYLLDFERKRVIGNKNLAYLCWLANFFYATNDTPQGRDTFWILGGNRNSNVLNQYDTLGNLRRSANMPSVIVGGDIWEPENLNLDSTVYIFLLSSNPTYLYQVSLGLCWRDLLKVHDISPTSIISPPALIDSSAIISPQIKVRNNGDFNENFSCYLNIANTYFDSIRINNLPPRRETTLIFSSLQMNFRDSILIVARTYLRDDQFPHNDTIKRMIFVRVKDVGVESIILPETIGVGETIKVRAKIKNFGNTSSGSFTTRLYLDTTILEQLTIPSLSPQEETLISFSEFTLPSGEYSISVNTYLLGDLNPNNNQRIKRLMVIGIKEEKKDLLKEEIIKLYDPIGRLISFKKKKGIYFLKKKDKLIKIVIY